MSYRKVTRVEKGSDWWDTNDPAVDKIGEHLPAGPGDVCYYDVFMQDTSILRVFNPDRVYFSPLMNIDVPEAPKIII